MHALLDAPLMALATSLASLVPAGNAPSPADSTLEVTGTAEVSVEADRARIAFAVETEGASAGEAGERNADIMESVLEALREELREEDRLETFGYQLRPRYRQPSRTEPQDPEIAGYVAVNHIRATADDVGTVGRLIDTAVEAGANRVSSLEFTVRDPLPARREALRGAVRNARAEAEAIADALGLALGAPITVRGDSETPAPRPVPVRDMMARAEAFETPIEPGRETITASVTIRYRLEQRP